VTAFTTLRDGGLRVYVGGVRREAAAHGLEWESTNQGDAGAGFWVEVADPFNPQAQYPELVHGAKVIVEHTLGAVTTRLYTGYVLSDPRAGYAGEKAVVPVLCGGAHEVAKSRGDVGFVFTDADASQWIANKKSPKCFSFDASGRIAITAGEDAKVRYDRAGIVGSVCYLGATHMLGAMNGWKRITGTASWDLRDHLKAALLWWPAYKVGLDASSYHVVHSWEANSKAQNRAFDYVFGGAGGAGYVALAMWCNRRGGIKTTDERFVELEDVVLYTDVAQKTVDQAMSAVAQFIGLASSYDVQTIGGVLRSLACRPYTDPASALATFAGQADRLVEWGHFGDVFRARPMLTDPAQIRALPNCYRVDAATPGITWDVTQHPENGIARALRLVYGHTGKTIWPAGSPAQVIAPADPGWAVGAPFMGTTSPVLTVDFSAHNYAEDHAKRIARSLASHLGVALSGGSASIAAPTVPVHGGGTRPAPYIHGADWIECEQGGAGPLYITRAHVDADTGYVDLDVGLSEDLLIEQLQAAGSATAVELHKPYRRRR
jgi:hypothetical protein